MSGGDDGGKWQGIAQAASSAMGMLDGVFNRNFTRQQNNRNRDAQINMWWANNLYNHPLAQKQRMIEAGMNPALMYGSPPQNTSTAANLPDGSPPQMDAFSQLGPAVQAGFDRYYNVRKFEIDEATSQRRMLLMDADTLKKNFESLESLSKTELNKANLAKLNALLPGQLDALKLNNENIELQNAYDAFRNEHMSEEQRAKMVQAYMQVRLAAKNIERIDQEIANAKTLGKGYELDNFNKRRDNAIKSSMEVIYFEQAKLWKNGINPNSSAWQRVLQSLFGGISDYGLDGVFENNAVGRDKNGKRFKLSY